MKNKKVIIIALAIFLILILTALLVKGVVKSPNVLMTNSDKTTATESDSKESTAENKMEEKNTTLADLLKLGTTQKCSFSSTTDNTSTKGTTYISGKNMRGDFEITLEDENKLQSHMISDGEWLYTWTSSAPQGMKIKIDTEEAEKAEKDIASAKGLETFRDKMNFDCKPWVADTTMFNTPTDVKFTDLSQTLKDVTSGSVNMCGACDMINDDKLKSECKARLNCK